MRFIESYFGRKPISPDEVDLNNINRILVIRQHDQLGDFLISTPILRAMREKLPYSYIALMVRNYTEPVARHNQYINELLILHEVGYDWSISKLLNFWKKLRNGYDLTIVINTVSHSLSTDILCWLSQAEYTLGPSHCLFPGTTRNFFYNLIALFVDDERHQAEKNLDIVRYVGINTKDLSEHITILPEEKKWAKQELKSLGFNFEQPIIGIHPGAGKLKNRWPVSRFVQVAKKSSKKMNAQFLLFSGPDEIELRDQFISEFKRAIYDRTRLIYEEQLSFGKDLRKLAAIFACLTFYIGNDTGTTHMVAAVSTPLIVIFGPTPANEWKPWGNQFIALQGKDGDCENVSVEDVYNKVEKLNSI